MNPGAAEIRRKRMCRPVLEQRTPRVRVEPPKVAKQRTVFVSDDPHASALRGFGSRTLSGVGVFESFPGQTEVVGQMLAADSGALAFHLRLAGLLDELPAESHRPLPIAAHIRTVSAPLRKPRYFAWLGGICVLGVVGLLLWPFEHKAVAHGVFKRYAQLEVAVSPLDGQVAAIHVATGQHVQAGAALLTLEASPLERQLSELNTTLDRSQRAFAQAQEASQAARDAELAKRAEMQRSIDQRATKKRAELKNVEDLRDDLLGAQAQIYVSPLKLSSVDDQIDARRRELRALADEHEKLRALVPSELGQSEARALAHNVETLRLRRSALERKLESKVVRAAQSGTIAQVIPASGDAATQDAPLVRILPEGPLTLIASFSARDTSDLGLTKSVTLMLGAGRTAQARIVRITRELAAEAYSVELALDDTGGAAQLDRNLLRDGTVSLEFQQQRTLAKLLQEIAGQV